MAYTKVNWQDSPSTATPITATNLNKMDNGIASADSGITTLNTNLNTTNTRIGTLSNLNTTNKTNIVSGVNEVNTKIGALASLNTTNKTNLVSGINEVNTNLNATNTRVGNLSALNTTNKTNIVSGINEVNTKVGNLSALNTTNKTNLVSGINEVNTKATPITNTFIPTLRGSINPGYFTYTKREGRYYKVGDIVFIDIELILASCTAIPTGFVNITGIPFAVKYQGNCQSVYVSGEGYRKINAWRLIPGDNSKVYLTAQTYVPGTVSSNLFGIEFGSDIHVEKGVQNSTIILSGIYLQKK